MVLQAMKSKGHTARFKSFCKSETMDTFLHACIDYFTIFFENLNQNTSTLETCQTS